MKDTVHRSSRPIAVTLAVALLAVSGVSSVAGIVAPGVNLGNPLSYVVLGIMVGVPTLLIWLIFKGKNWARWVFLVLYAAGLLFSPLSFQRWRAYSHWAATFYCLEMLLLLASAVALCLRPARRWFRGGTDEA